MASIANCKRLPEANPHQIPLYIPSGKLTVRYFSNGPVEIVNFPMKNGGSFHSYASLPEGN